MRIAVQRVREASADVERVTVGRIGPGLLLLVGVARGDTPADADVLVRKSVALRCFPGRYAQPCVQPVVGKALPCVWRFTEALPRPWR